MRHLGAALVLAAALSFSLAGCFGQTAPTDELLNTVTGIAEDAMDVARTLGDIDWGKTTRAVIRDAATGTELTELTNQVQIDEVFSPLSQVNGIAPTPDAAPEYIVEIWEPETIKLGQAAGDVNEYKTLEVTVYGGTDVVTLTVVPIDLTINLASEGGVADAIRALVQPR